MRIHTDEYAQAQGRIQDWLALIAHELRNPLAPISDAARLLRIGAHDPETVRATGAVLERQVALLSRLVNDLLDASRVEQSRLTITRESVELATVVEQAIETVRAYQHAMRHQLSIALPSEPVYVHADAGRLSQVVVNLLTNACRFTEPGGRIWLTAWRDGKEVVISVRDNGVGIATDDVQHIFEMFSQVTTSAERVRHGLGIGLALVKSIVHMHEGTVAVHSEGPGCGAEFTVRLPIVTDVPPPPPARGEVAPPPVRRRVLIVDDNHDAARSLARLLDLAAHETFVAHDGLDALDAAAQLRPDVVLLDLTLPALTGYEVCRRLRQERWAEGLMVIAVTGWGQAEDRRRTRQAGFDAHFVKPVDHDALLSLLSNAPVHDGTLFMRSRAALREQRA